MNLLMQVFGPAFAGWLTEPLNASLEPEFMLTPASSTDKRITPEDLRHVALTLLERHGARALGYADLAVEEMEEKGEAVSAEAWKVLRSVIADALGGRLLPDGHIVLH